jgi:Holliday junction resolvase RusA-like endonuclease
MNEMQVIVVGLIALGASVVFFYYTDVVPKQIENREMDIIISLSIGLLILIVDKRQNRYLDEIIQNQHKTTQDIHNMIKQEIELINEIRHETKGP